MNEVISAAEYKFLTRKNKVSGGRIVTKKLKRGKFNNQIVIDEVDGRFDSKKEYEEWKRLKILAGSGVIQDLKRQVRIPLVVNGHKVCTYVADYQYRMKGELITADAKGVATDVFKIKEKLFFALTGTKIRRC